MRLTVIIEGVHDDAKFGDPLEVIFGIFDIPMPGVYLDPRGRVEMSRCSCCYKCLGLANIRFAKEELSIEVGQVNGIKVDLRVSRPDIPAQLTISIFEKPTRTRFFTAH